MFVPTLLYGSVTWVLQKKKLRNADRICTVEIQILAWCRGRLRLTFKDSPKSMYEKVNDSAQGKRDKVRETVAFGAPFSLTTPLGIQRKTSL